MSYIVNIFVERNILVHFQPKRKIKNNNKYIRNIPFGSGGHHFVEDTTKFSPRNPEKQKVRY